MSSGVTPSLSAAERHRGVRRHAASGRPSAGPACAIRLVPILMPTSAKTELSEYGRGAEPSVARARVGVVVVVDDELLLAARVRNGEDPLLRRPDRVRARCPRFERLGEDERLERSSPAGAGLGGEVERPRRCSRVPPTIARTSPVWLSIATSAAVGPSGFGERAVDRGSAAACCRSRSSVVRTCSPPSNARAGAVRSTSCWLTQVVKYGGLACSTFGGDDRLGRERLLRCASSYSGARDLALLEHLREHHVAPRVAASRVRDRVEGARVGDDRRRAAPPRGARQLLAHGRAWRAAAQVVRVGGRSRCAPRTRSRRRRCRSRSCSGTR